MVHQLESLSIFFLYAFKETIRVLGFSKLTNRFEKLELLVKTAKCVQVSIHRPTSPWSPISKILMTHCKQRITHEHVSSTRNEILNICKEQKRNITDKMNWNTKNIHKKASYIYDIVRKKNGESVTIWKRTSLSMVNPW